MDSFDSSRSYQMARMRARLVPQYLDPAIFGSTHCRFVAVFGLEFFEDRIRLKNTVKVAMVL